MTKAIFIDFYGTIVYEDGEIIEIVTKEIEEYFNKNSKITGGSNHEIKKIKCIISPIGDYIFDATYWV